MTAQATRWGAGAPAAWTPGFAHFCRRLCKVRNESSHRPSRTAASVIALRASRTRSSLERRRNLRSFPVVHLDEPLGQKLLKQGQEVVLATRGLDVVLPDEQIADFSDAMRLLQKRPHARADGIEAVIHAVFEVEDGCLATQIAGELVFDSRHHGPPGEGNVHPA